MLERLLDLLVNTWDAISPFTIVKQYEGGIVLRLGKYHRTLGPGLAWKWPMIETALTTKTCVTTMRLPAQSILAADGTPMMVSTVVKYQISDVRPFLVDIWDAYDVLADVTAGAVRMAVQSFPVAMANTTLIEADVLDRIRRGVHPYGFKVHQVTLVDYVTAPTLRLAQMATAMSPN